MTSNSPSAPYELVCTECGHRYAFDEVSYVCPSCATKQLAGGMTRGILEVDWDKQALRTGWEAYLAAHGTGAATGMGAVRHLLPLGPGAPSLPVLVGDTPLASVPRLRERLGMPNLWVKDDTREPSASYKDRASALVCLHAAQVGEQTIVAASTGNAATALSCMAAALGQRAIILVPASAPIAKLAQIASYGATVIPVDGSYDDAFELSLQATSWFGWYNRNTAYNPLTIEGKKTGALELVRDLGQAPDVVIVPTGDGVILSGIAKGFRDLQRAGVIEQVPRMIAVQADGSAAIAKAVREGGDVQMVPDAHTVADSICVAAPRAGLLAVEQIKRSRGSAVVVSDDAIVEAIGELARFGAVFAEPAGAASLAGLHQARVEGLVSDRDLVVLMVTGHGLKDVPAAQRGVSIPSPVQPTEQALRERLSSIQT